MESDTPKRLTYVAPAGQALPTVPVPTGAPAADPSPATPAASKNSTLLVNREPPMKSVHITLCVPALTMAPAILMLYQSNLAFNPCSLLFQLPKSCATLSVNPSDSSAARLAFATIKVDICLEGHSVVLNPACAQAL